MSYLPPHKRQSAENEWTTVKRKPSKVQEKPKKKEYSEEFPSLNKEMETLPRLTQISSSKPTLSTLFKNSLNRKHKKKQSYIKKGWVLLTFNGMVDSLTPEERRIEDEEHESRIAQIHIEHLVRKMDSLDNWRRENDHTYLWEWERTRDEFDKFEPDDDSSTEYYSETDTDIYDEENPDELDFTI
jgi:hypothetical protein